MPHNTNITPSSPSINGKFKANSSAGDAISDAMHDDRYNKIKELQDLIRTYIGLEQPGREIGVESETMKNSNAKTRQNFVMLDCGKFHRELGRIYMKVDTHKLIFDDNYQVVAIE